MPTPCESCPIRLAVTRFSATVFASRASLPPAATTASIARVRGSFLKTSAMVDPVVVGELLFRLDAAALHDLRPAIDFFLHELAEFLGGARHHVEADLRHA